MKISKILFVGLLFAIIPAHGMFRGLRTTLGNAMRSSIGARLLMAQRKQPFKSFTQPSRSFGHAAKFGLPATCGFLGLGAKSFDEQVKEKENEINKVVEKRLNQLKFPIRVREYVQASGNVAKDEDYSDPLHIQQCDLQGICLTQKIDSDRAQKTNTLLMKRTYGVPKLPQQESLKHTLLKKSLTLNMYDSEFKKCFAEFPKSKEQVMCRALFNIVDVDSMDSSATKVDAKTEIDEQVTPQLQPVHRCTIDTDGSAEFEPIHGFGEAYILI